MSTTRKIAIGIGLAGGALLAAYFLSGDRKKKTQKFITQSGKKLKEVLTPKVVTTTQDQDIGYA